MHELTKIKTERITLTEYEKYTEIKKSPIQGKGLFATIKLPQGIVLKTIEGKLCTHSYHPSLSEKNPNWMGIGYEEWLEFYPGDRTVYINHSCCPNVIINDKLELITMRPIEKNEELLLDYSTTELDPTWKMHCTCGDTNCRRILKSFQFLPYALQVKYSQYLAPVFKQFRSAPLA